MKREPWIARVSLLLAGCFAGCVVAALLGGPAAASPRTTAAVGTLVVATDATRPPAEFVGADGHTILGLDADLAQALANVLGYRLRIVDASLDTIVPGLVSGKYDLGMSSLADTRAREQAVDFVTYLSAGTSFYVKARGGPAIATLASLCGHWVAVEAGTTQAGDAAAQSAKCAAAGKPRVRVSAFPDEGAASRAVSSGRAQVAMADSPAAAYAVKQSRGRLEISGPVLGAAPFGIAIPKDSHMAEPVLDALKTLMADGTYGEILAKWGLRAGAIANPKINGATG